MNQLSKKINEGVSVYKNSHSPSGYTATFIYKPTQDIIKVSLTGPFFYIDPNIYMIKTIFLHLMNIGMECMPQVLPLEHSKETT